MVYLKSFEQATISGCKDTLHNKGYPDITNGKCACGVSPQTFLSACPDNYSRVDLLRATNNAVHVAKIWSQ